MNAGRGDASGFWAWFAAHERGLRTEGRPPEDLLDDVLAELQRYCKGLGFELYKNEERGDRRFIVTAFGQPDWFLAVEDLVDAAPPNLEWRAIALKPAKGFTFVVERGHREYDPKRLMFDPLPGRTTLGALPICVYVDDYDPDCREQHYLAVEDVLLTALGERTMVEDVLLVEVAPLDEKACADALRLEELPSYVTWWRKRHDLGT